MGLYEYLKAYKNAILIGDDLMEHKAFIELSDFHHGIAHSQYVKGIEDTKKIYQGGKNDRLA